MSFRLGTVLLLVTALLAGCADDGGPYNHREADPDEVAANNAARAARAAGSSASSSTSHSASPPTSSSSTTGSTAATTTSSAPPASGACDVSEGSRDASTPHPTLRFNANLASRDVFVTDADSTAPWSDLCNGGTAPCPLPTGTVDPADSFRCTAKGTLVLMYVPTKAIVFEVTFNQ